MTSDTGSPLRLVAIHEAAHAVVATVLGIEVVEVTVVPANGTAGRTRYSRGSTIIPDDGSADSPAAQAWVTDRVVLLAAGLAAEVYMGRDPEGCDGDLEAAVRMFTLVRWGGDRLSELVKRSANLVRANWTAIEVVAEELVERGTLSGDELREVLKDVVTVRT